jgi:hypothetical protein
MYLYSQKGTKIQADQLEESIWFALFPPHAKATRLVFHFQFVYAVYRIRIRPNLAWWASEEDKEMLNNKIARKRVMRSNSNKVSERKTRCEERENRK